MSLTQTPEPSSLLLLGTGLLSLAFFLFRKNRPAGLVLHS
ncbi:MAG: PEP-CTERM sorting domain-containing protein [Terracidiphilus sp.]